MKKVKVMVSGILMFFSVAVFAQSTTDNLPTTAKDFINKHFSSASIEEVNEGSSWEIWEDDAYEVRFTNGIEVDFDKNGNVVEIDSQKKAEIPEAAIPTKINSYLKSNYATSQITGWEKSDKGHEIELMDGTEIEFDKNEKFVKID